MKSLETLKGLKEVTLLLHGVRKCGMGVVVGVCRESKDPTEHIHRIHHLSTV